MSHFLPKQTSVEVTPPLASYVADETGGTGIPYTGDGRMGDMRGNDREATNDSKRGFYRKDMAKSYSQYCDGSRKRSKNY